MQRKKFLQYSVLGSASFLVEFSLLNRKHIDTFLSANMKKDKIYDWIFLYWMPYDNNLSKFGTPIFEMLAKGIQSDNVLVVIQSNFSGVKQISRNLFLLDDIVTQKLEATDSSSEKVFAEYLRWANSQFQAKKWAVVILGHGGRLDEISPDEHPLSEAEPKTKWMNIQKLSTVLERFNSEVDKRIELFFFQNCNKGTLEANYTFRNTAKYTLSSQLILGAPNYYYEPLLKFLGRNPEINGGQLAEKIMEFEPSDMYYSFTCVNNNAIHSLPDKFNSLINSIISSNIKAIKLNELKIYYYMNEQFVDVVSFLKTITKQSGVQEQEYNEFANFFNYSLIKKNQKNGTLIDPDSRKEYQNFSGLGIFLPRNRQELEKYYYLQAFTDLKLVKLFELILFN